MSELDEVKARLATLERTPIPEDSGDRRRLRLKIQGCHKRIGQLCRVIELEQSK